MANRYSQLPLSVVEKYYPESPYLDELRAQQNFPFQNTGIIQTFPNQTFNYDYIQQDPYNFTGFNKDVLAEEEDAQYFPEEKNIFQRSYDYLNDPTKNAQRGIMSYLLTANPLVAAASFFAPKIIGGIGNIRNNMSDFITNLFNKPAAQIPANTFFGDTDMTRGGGGATTGSGQSVSSSDLSSIGNTGFSEYSSPGVASSYEGSS
jgi:hypothetical protein